MKILPQLSKNSALAEGPTHGTQSTHTVGRCCAAALISGKEEFPEHRKSGRRHSTALPSLICVAWLVMRAFATTAFSQDLIPIPKIATQLIPINISGFTGEADAVLRFDLSVLGLEPTTADRADYLISGTANGQLEGRVKRGGGGAEVLSRIYSSGDARVQAHAFANDIVKIVRDTAPIFLSRIAYCQSVGRDWELFVSDYDGHNPIQMTRDASLVATPAWSPGGRKLFYTSWRSSFTQVLEQDTTTGKRSIFSAYGGGNFSPAVSPDGRQVALVLSKGGSPNLYVCDIDGRNLRELTHGRDDISSPTWSPDSREICYVERPGRATLRKISASGGDSAPLRVGIGGNLTSPDWSPDGRKIVFTSGSVNFNICVANPDGSDAEVLVPGEDPCWAPNSRTVIFSKRVNNQRVLSLLDVPTKHVKDVGQISGSRSQPAWAR